MPPWWGKSSSKDTKKRTKENLIDTLHRFISSGDQKSSTESKGNRRKSNNIVSAKGSQSRAESRTTSPSKNVSRCQSFSDRPQPLPLPHRPGVTRTASEIGISRPLLEKRGKRQLMLPLPPHTNCLLKKPEINEACGTDFPTPASNSSNCSGDSDDPGGGSQLHSPAGTDVEIGHRPVRKNHASTVHRDVPPSIPQKHSREQSRPANISFANRNLSTSPKCGAPMDHFQIGPHNTRHASTLESAPNSLMSSPSRSPRRICPDQIPTSAFWAVKPHAHEVTFLGSGQCSSPGSGQTSGHNSVGGDMLGQLLWQQPSRGSPECSPLPSPRMTSGPSSRIHSGSVSPLHPRAGGMAPESPTNCRLDEAKKQTHKLPLPPPITICNNSPFSPNNSMANSPLTIPKSPGRTENPPSPGSRWKKGKLLGRGTFGHVYVGFNSDSGEMCAMKEVTIFSDDPKSKESQKQLSQEIYLLSKLRHPNIVQYYGSETVEDKLYIYLEYVSGGSIHKLLREYGQFGEPAIRSYTQQILSGLTYLHAKNTVHRDIKGANILVDPNGRVKLADFGMAKHISGQSCPFSFKGSPYWMAPEVIKNSNGCNLAVDIWSLGCTVLEMVTSKPPWSQYEGIAAVFKIGNSKELPAIPENLSEEGKDFIMQCLQRDPTKRPTAAELLQHPFIKAAAPLEKFNTISDPLVDRIAIAPSMSVTKGGSHLRHLSSLGTEGQTIQQRRGAKLTSISSDIHLRNNISCPVSPTRSPLLRSRSPHNGHMTPSPISSPRTTSGASTPLTGGTGAIPFSSLNHSSSYYLTNDGLVPSIRGQQCSPAAFRERIISESDILSPHFGKLGHGSLRDPYDSQSHADNGSRRMKLNPSLDLRPGNTARGY
ncbi:mitogen-activated protein kinase kinase kinase 3 [Rhynchospora pubera]|uniref:mitogen-activated protein kinase kinase kinase n=1 Tax=Rhynchospora pubera TaxID=906938 RepID=A0AAV8CXL4_9POAL|nr:mitogen-activated protein kinase kinase kinase 3 [Rhynchospora pubera]